MSATYPFGYSKLTGAFDGIYPPLHRHLEGYFEPIELPGVPVPTPAFLYILCASQPHSLDNAECVNLGHVWVE